MSRASKQVGTNVTKKLLSEMQALIAFACYDSPTIAQGGDSMTETTMAETMTALYFGGDDPEIISYLDQFINGLHRFAGLYTSSEPDEFGILVLTMPQKLHRHGGLNIFVGPTSISKELLSKKNFANKNEKIAGRTLLRKAKEVVTTCKKMMGLVTASGSPYRDGTFPSGTNWDDYIKWCLVAMQSNCDREAKAKLLNVVATTRDESATTTMMTDSSAGTVTMTESAVTILQVDNIGRDRLVEQQPLPPGSFFKPGVGFLAWALWGHIPLHDGEQMISRLFNEVKANTSFGRGTSTRSVMRKALIAASAAPADNRRGKKRNADTVGMDTNSFVPPLADNVEDLALLTKTLKHLAAEAMEKEEKQHHHLRVRLVRDKLAARRRRSEVLLQQLTLSSKFKKKPDSTLFDKMNANEEEIEKLEDELATLQELECKRHSEMMAKRRSMPARVPTMIGMNPIGVGESFESSGNDSGGGTDSTSTPRQIDSDSRNDDMTLCMECNVIPTKHICLKCREVRVCACCCDTNRGLHNITWCKTCFDDETPDIQQIIRNGDYDFTK